MHNFKLNSISINIYYVKIVLLCCILVRSIVFGMVLSTIWCLDFFFFFVYQFVLKRSNYYLLGNLVGESWLSSSLSERTETQSIVLLLSLTNGICFTAVPHFIENIIIIIYTINCNCFTMLAAAHNKLLNVSVSQLTRFFNKIWLKINLFTLKLTNEFMGQLIYTWILIQLYFVLFFIDFLNNLIFWIIWKKLIFYRDCWSISYLLITL